MRSDIVSLVSEALDRCQRQPTGECVLLVPVPIGLGGQITARVETLCLALALGRTAMFLGVDDPPYTQTMEALGPVEAATYHYVDQLPLVALDGEQADPVVVYNPLKWSAQSEPGVLLKWVSDRLAVPLADDLELFGAVLAWMRSTAPIRAMVEGEAERLGVDQDVLGVHFRRGDKQVETPFVPAAEFNSKIAEIHKIWKFSGVFIASDSNDALKDIIVPEGVRTIFDHGEQRYNNANHKMLISQPQLAQAETQVAYKNLALLGQCGGIVGQDNAHFATLAAATMIARGTSRDRVALIDGRIRERGSILVAWQFLLRSQLRRIARICLPWLTTAARIRRNAPVNRR